MSRAILYTILIIFLLMNVFAAIHAYRFTHFSESGENTRPPDELSFSEKLGVLVTGIVRARPINEAAPSYPYITVRIRSNVGLECWYAPAADSSGAIGTVALFHGYGSSKSALLDRASIFHNMGYNIMLVDFMGSGGSEGNQTTIGFKEAENVKSVVDYLAQKGEKNIILFGNSMGAAASIRALSKYDLPVSKAILECPFGSMMQTVKNRFAMMHVPAFPMVQLMVFWGGVENGFNAFSFSPERYAKKVKCPVLLMYGAVDSKVTEAETEAIFANFAGPKKLAVYPEAGHENYLIKYRAEWKNDVTEFLGK